MALVLNLGPTAARADSVGREYVAGATASGMYVTYGIPGYQVVENYVDGGGPVAQSVQASDGLSSSFASLPYPGSTFAGYPGVVALVTGHTPPGYPLYVTASYPTKPEERVAEPAGMYEIAAQATEGGGTALARFTAPGDAEAATSGGRANTAVVVDGDSVTATAVSTARGLSAGPLSVASIVSKATTTYNAGASAPTTSNDFLLDGGKAGDLAFSYGPKGLEVSKQGVPLPASDGLATLNQTLAPSGLKIGFVKSSGVQGGAAATAFEIVSEAEVPGAGKGTLRVQYGNALSYITIGADTEEPEAVEEPAPSAGDVPIPIPSSDGLPSGSTELPVPSAEQPFATSTQATATDGTATEFSYEAGSGALSSAEAELAPVRNDATVASAADGSTEEFPAELAVANPSGEAHQAMARQGRVPQVGSTSLVAGVLAGATLIGAGLLAVSFGRKARRWAS